MRLIHKLLIIIFIFTLISGCSGGEQQQVMNYNIKNDSSISILSSDFEKLYEKSKNGAIAWIDSIEESEYLPAEKCSLSVFNDKSAIFLLGTSEKPGIKDNSVMVTFSYSSNEKAWEREKIIYNDKEYGDK